MEELETMSLGRSEETGGRGAGGKFKKHTSRKPPVTPYSRPPQQSRRGRGLWFSKLVDPAYRLVNGIPSLFFKSMIPPSLPAQESSRDGMDEEEKEEEEWEEEEEEEEKEEGWKVSGNDNGNAVVNGMVPISTDIAGTSRVGHISHNRSVVDGHERAQEVDTSGSDILSDIEKLIGGKKFSRDEFDRLMEIIRSRSVDSLAHEQENKHSSVIAVNVGGSEVVHSGTLAENKLEKVSRSALGASKFEENKYSRVNGGDVGLPTLTLEKTDPSPKQPEGLNKCISWSSTPLKRQSYDVGNSPIDIAKAYMKNRKSEAAVSPSKELVLEPAMYWPGAVVQDQYHSMTPRSERGRFWNHNFPQTPYSRTPYSVSKSKLIHLQGSSGGHPNLTSSPSDQSKVHTYGVGTPLVDGHRSVGPIRRKETPKSANSRSVQVANFDASHGFFSPENKNLEAGTSSSTKLLSVDNGAPTSSVGVPSHSSRIAQKILEQLERYPPTPKDKSAELKLAISWKKSSESNMAIGMEKNNNSSQLGNLDSSKKAEEDPKKSTVHWYGDKELLKSEASARETADEAKNGAPAVGIKARTFPGSRFGPYSDARKHGDSQIMNKQEEPSRASGSQVSTFQKKPPLTGNRPALPSIAVSKPAQKWALSSDHSSGFTFPVSASSGALEPPTPSIAPSSSSSGLNPQTDGVSIPSYSFGSSKSAALVFSFPSTSSPPVDNDAVDLKFTFGSDQGTRISFGSIDGYGR